MEKNATAKNDDIYLDLMGQMEEEKEENEKRKEQHKEIFLDLLEKLSGTTVDEARTDIYHNANEIEQIDYSLTNTVCFFLQGTSNHIDMIIGIDDYSKLIRRFPRSKYDIHTEYKDNDLHIKPFWVSILNKVTNTRLDVIVVYNTDKTFLKLSNKYMCKGTFDGNSIKLIPILPIELLYSLYIIFQDKYQGLDKKVEQIREDMLSIGIYYRDIFKKFIDSDETSEEVKGKLQSVMI